MKFPITLAVLLAAVTTTGAPAAEPVHIDVILSQTGTAAFLGQGETQALKILQGVVNTKGGIAGRPVQFDIGDDQSTPTQAVALMNSAQAHKPGALLGTGFTATCLAILPLAARNNGPATYCMTPGVHPAAGSYGFSANVGTESIAPVMLRFFKEKGWTRFAFMNSTDASGQDVLEAVTRAMKLPEFKPMTMVAEEHFNTSDISVSAQIARIKSAQPQAVIFWTAGTGFGTVLRNAHDAGLDIPTIGGNANELYAQNGAVQEFLADRTLLSVAALDRRRRHASRTDQRRAERILQGVQDGRAQAGSLIDHGMGSRADHHRCLQASGCRCIGG